MAKNNQPSIRQLQEVLNNAYDSEVESFKDMLFDCMKVWNDRNALQQGAQGNPLHNYLLTIANEKDQNNAPSQNAVIKLMVMLLNQRPSLGDSIWLRWNEAFQDNPGNQDNYAEHFSVVKKRGRTSITDLFVSRKFYRNDLNDQIRAIPDIPVPKFANLGDYKTKTYEEIKSIYIEPDFLTKLRILPNQGQGQDAAYNNFCTFFQEYVTNNMGDMEYLIEEAVNCLYFQLDQTALIPFTSLKAVRRDQSIHRATRFFLTNCPISILSALLLNLGGTNDQIQREIKVNMHTDDRGYMDDCLMTHEGANISYRTLVEINPFAKQFNEGVDKMEGVYGLFQIPVEDVYTKKCSNDATKLDADDLVNAIYKDSYFRKITNRQMTDWCNIDVDMKVFPYGKWSHTYELKVDTTFKNFKEDYDGVVWKMKVQDVVLKIANAWV